MLPSATTAELARLGHDAVSTAEVGLNGADDAEVMEFAVVQSRVVVTENFADFARLVELRLGREEPCVPVVFVRKADLPSRGALPFHLAAHLARWAEGHTHPFVGCHWP